VVDLLALQQGDHDGVGVGLGGQARRRFYAHRPNTDTTGPSSTFFVARAKNVELGGAAP
jgi:hypothetical protein